MVCSGGGLQEYNIEIGGLEMFQKRGLVKKGQEKK